MVSVIFTHVRNVDMNILLQLDDESLHSVCQVDKYTKSLCSDNVFWHLKLNKAYPGLPIPKGYQQKLKELYQILTKKDITKWAVANGHLEVLKWLAQTKNIYPSQFRATLAAMNGQLEVLKWLAGHNIYPDRAGANSAAGKGHLEVLKWLAQTRNLYPNQWGTNYAAENGQLEVLKWLAATINLYPDQEGTNWAANNGQLEVSEWLATTINLYPNRRYS